ncbi:restriction endonuclease subunit S [Acinetobacter indicus]|uniref:restriction endonuclease subunit S n=1 Tax=Acinetobacter indicus TaxID=756892 RepID=UPI0009488D02|nr:restriction endonuclease subunit S [Acinetobacter indicus]
MATPKLRFKEFDGDWNKSTIGNFVLNYKGGASLTPADFVEYSDCEVIPKKAISSGGLLQLDKVVPTFCTLEFFNSNQNYIVDSEYLITTLRDLVPSGPSIGYIVKYESNKKYILAQGVYGFRIKNDLNRDFLIQFSNTSKFRLHMQSIMVGSTQVHIRNQDYFSTELYTPSLIEQTKIASFLSNVDEKISQLTQKHELLSQYKQGMMQKLFSQQLRFKADDGSEFGEWEEKLIKDIADVKGGKRIPKGYPLVNENTGHPYITVSDMNRSYSIDSTNIRYVPLEVVDTIKRYTITDKDIFISVAGTLGIIGKIPTEFNGANLTENADKLTNLKCHQDFLIYLLDSGYLSELIESTATTSAQPKLALYAIEQLEVQIPCPEEQTKIANFLSAIDQKIEVVAQQIEQAKQWKKGLLQQMFV